MIEHLEPIIDATIATLKNPGIGVNATIRQLNAERPTGPQLGEVADDAFYPGGWTLLKYPSVEVAIADFDLSELSLGQVDYTISTPFVLRGWVQDARAEPGNLYLRALRFSTALLRVLIQPDAFGDNAQIDDQRPVRGAYRFNPEDDERQELEASCLLVFYLKAVDSRV